MTSPLPDLKTETPRQKLRRFVDTGTLRYTLERANVEQDVIDLLVKVISNYCEPRRKEA